MTKRESKAEQKGIVLPSVFSVLFILMMLVTAITSLGTTSLRQAAYFSQDDQALFAADAGLARALADYQATGELQEASGPGQSVSGTIESTGASYSVSLHLNPGPGVLQVPGGSSIPPGTAFLISEGRSRSKLSTRRSAVLVQNGLGTVQVGSLSNSIKATNTTFSAFDSNREAAGYVGAGVDPNSLLSTEAIIATNESTGQPIVLQDTEVKGDLLVGPGGDPSAQVSKTGTTSTGRIGVLTEKIEIPPIEVPSLPGKDEFGAPPAPAYYKPTTNPEHVSFTQNANGQITIINQCMKCVIEPDGSFVSTEDGGRKLVGNLKTGEITQNSGYTVTIDGDSFEFGAYWHGIGLDSAGNLIVDTPTNNSGDKWGEGSRQSFSAPDWLTDNIFKNPPPDELNPASLETGYFGDIVIDSGKTVLQDSSTLVVKNLIIKDGGQLNLPNNGKDVTIYVTGQLDISGLNAILNESRKAPELKIFYTGTKPVRVSGGASTFLTLIAPDAEVVLDGEGSTFFGALVSQSLVLNDAEFYYDVATDGVGTGTDGTTLTVLAHQRF